ncbi:aspartyl/asparaginyl beta-hydroxylase domain-containing protein [Glaciecola sp. MH2013]|uniref:aspartyl/asparaginyl beta-hydroxylase domain-containing protein n=1 Tax=Glaciecola sp. MH2013 TaxID=2785524 RepID=UPI00189C7C17|nr:aspartyl/asparaginyl beta-hydroxylase domain-containing protein [Glaciecola sp. MH2013]MBF7072437.1 aspartyl/asparaginyl beta-hydroxylase domain-containing protein [Glaciecola sp. MH2013]
MTEDEIKQSIDSISLKLNSDEISEGVNLARALAKSEPSSFAALNFLANVEEQLGDREAAKDLHKSCIRLNEATPIAYLSLGYLLSEDCHGQLKASPEAIVLFSKLFDMAPQWFYDHQSFNFNPQVMQKLVFAGRTLLVFFDELHRNALTLDVENQDTSYIEAHTKPSQYAEERVRIAEAIWTRTHLRPFSFALHDQRPHLFYVPNLVAKGVWELEQFPWAEAFCKQYPDILAEFRAVTKNIADHARPYLDEHFENNAELTQLAGKQRWTALDLYREGLLSNFAKQHFPKTLAALKLIPLCGRGDNPDEVFFSILQAGQAIPEHYGLSNHSLTVHLGIDIPDNCTLSVRRSDYYWKNGELIVFDDSFIHSAKNDSDKLRVVLLFSIWHPHLSGAEIKAIKSSFTQRHNWFESRDEKLKAIMSEAPERVID